MLAKGRFGGQAFSDFGLVGEGEFLQVLDGADVIEIHARLGELLLIEGRIRLEIGHLIAQPFFLNTAHLIKRLTLDLVPEAVVHLVGGVLPPEAHSKLHVVLPSRPRDQ